MGKKRKRNDTVEELGGQPKRYIWSWIQAATALCKTVGFPLFPNDLWFFTTLEEKEAHYHWSDGWSCCQGLVRFNSLCVNFLISMDFSGSIFGGFPVIGDGLDRSFCNVFCPWWKWWLVLDSWRRVGFMCPFSYGLIGVWFCFLGLEDVKERFFFFNLVFVGLIGLGIKC